VALDLIARQEPTSPNTSRTARVANVPFYNVHDGPGIRTVVFLKGCPLSCQWCSNPETIDPEPELGLIRSLCTGCGKCLDVCPERALFLDDDSQIQVDRERCDNCGRCLEACLPDALTLYGEMMSAEQVFEQFQKDKMFFGSEGGATFSGGEAMLQPDFVAEVFALCQQDGIHTCLETTGSASKRAWRKVLPFTDMLLYDLKHMDSDKHRQRTHVPNTLILDNARWLATQGVQILFRVPLIPGFNDDDEHIAALAEFVKELEAESVLGIELMPYHRLGGGKYQSLDKPYVMGNLDELEPAQLEAICNEINARGVRCSISR